jgi:hypothetical protein
VITLSRFDEGLYLTGEIVRVARLIFLNLPAGSIVTVSVLMNSRDA